MIVVLDEYMPKFQYKLVKSFPPPIGLWKCNKLEVWRGNPGLIFESFCVWDINGEIMCGKYLNIVYSLSWLVRLFLQGKDQHIILRNNHLRS